MYTYEFVYKTLRHDCLYGIQRIAMLDSPLAKNEFSVCSEVLYSGHYNDRRVFYILVTTMTGKVPR